jgi:hypothetical protein
VNVANNTCPLNRSIIFKLLAFTFAMITFPIGSYFLSVNMLFGGMSYLSFQTSHPKPPNMFIAICCDGSEPSYDPVHCYSSSSCSKNIKPHQQPLTLSSRQLNLRRRHRRHRSKHRPDRLRGRSLQRRQVRARSRHRIGCHLTAERGEEREINPSSRERGERMKEEHFTTTGECLPPILFIPFS